MPLVQAGPRELAPRALPEIFYARALLLDSVSPGPGAVRQRRQAEAAPGARRNERAVLGLAARDQFVEQIVPDNCGGFAGF